MKTTLLARALGAGVTAAAMTSFSTWRELLQSRETLSESFEDDDGWIAVYECLAIQELDELGRTVIEVRVLAADINHELTAWYYAAECQQRA
jgi:hypothetical protein